MGGRGGSSGAGGKGGGGLGADIRRVYQRLVNAAPRAEAGWVELADLRDALPHVGHQQFTDAIKTLARTDPGVKLIPWDNVKAVTARQRAAGFNFGDRHVHVIHMGKG